MGQRTIKRLRRQIRNEQNKLLQKSLRPKPKFVPIGIWVFFLKFFMTVEK